MNNTPQANRVHIGIFGKCNSGKSSLINAITGQNTAVVSEIAGTTTDPVVKSMEVYGIGACTFIDTAGFDDNTALGQQRLEKTETALNKTDIAIIVFNEDNDYTEELRWIRKLEEKKIPVIGVLNKTDQIADVNKVAESIEQKTGIKPIAVSAQTNEGIKALISALSEISRETNNPDSIVGNLAQEGDVVMLVMPQDIQAPKGRLILPQVQTIRDLLDKKCIVVSCTTEKIEDTLKSLAFPPKLIITDSQIFNIVSNFTPKESKLTSFSVLFARYKGDIHSFVKGANAIDKLTENSRILIAEACTHAPLTEDIGREKIPRMLRKKVGENLKVDIVSGSDFPKDLSPYDLIIHCGACMFNRQHVLSRVAEAEKQNIPITNYGIAIAKLTNILDKVVYPD